MTEPPQPPEGAENPETPAPPPPYPTYPAPPAAPQAPPPAYGQAPYGQAPYGQPPYPQAPYPPTGQNPYAAPKTGTNGFAIAALVFGIIPICLLGVVFGIVALVQTSKSGQKGKGMAIAGLVLSGLWVIGLVTVGVVAGMNDAGRDHSGAITKEGQLSADKLHVGDCFNGLSDVKDGDTVQDITGVPCSKPHEAEDFAHVQLDGKDYPGKTALQDQSMGRPCVEKLREVAPTAYAKKAVAVIWIYPQKTAWDLGNHHLECIAVTDVRQTGSVIE